ncbi:MAG: hypothetical protein AAFX87_08685 [Bacteroidota bacterium]
MKSIILLTLFPSIFLAPEIRHDGVYQSEVENGYYSYLRFFEDGTVIYQYTNWSAKSVAGHTLNYNTKQFKPNGFYTLEGGMVYIPMYDPKEKKLLFFKGTIDKKGIIGRFYENKSKGTKKYPIRTFRFKKE